MLKRLTTAAPEVRDIAAEAGNDEEITGVGWFKDFDIGFGRIEPYIRKKPSP